MHVPFNLALKLGAPAPWGPQDGSKGGTDFLAFYEI